MITATHSTSSLLALRKFAITREQLQYTESRDTKFAAAKIQTKFARKCSTVEELRVGEESRRRKGIFCSIFKGKRDWVFPSTQTNNTKGKE